LTGDPQLPRSAAEVVDAVLIKGQSSPAALFDLIERLLPNATLIPRHAVKIDEQRQEVGLRKPGKAS